MGKTKLDNPGRVVDIHSHVLPGVDDGAGDRREALEMLRIAYEEGITDMIVTPHYQSGRFFTPAEVVEEKIRDLEALAEHNGLPIRFYPGTEIYYRSELEDKLEDGQLATMNGSNYLLVEFSPMQEFSYIRNAFSELRSLGFIPILAHVERYQCMREDIDRVAELRRLGCEIQVNAGSIVGKYGLTTKWYCGKLLRQQLVDYLGTDAHNAGGRAPEMHKCTELLYKKYELSYVDKILYKNAVENLLGCK